MQNIVESSNAEIISRVSKNVIPLAMLRLESLVGYLVEEPNNISLTLTKGANPLVLRPILRLSVNYPNDKLVSTSIYANSNMTEFVVRKVDWDKVTDINKIKSSQEQRDELLNGWPEVKIDNFHLSNPAILECIKPLDEYLMQGVKIAKRTSTTPRWSEMRYKRLFDWGYMDIELSVSVENAMLEKNVFIFQENIENILLQSKNKCYKIELDYLIPAESMKGFISGR